MWAGYQPEIASLKAQPIGYNFLIYYQSNLNLNCDSDFKKFVNYCTENEENHYRERSQALPI